MLLLEDAVQKVELCVMMHSLFPPHHNKHSQIKEKGLMLKKIQINLMDRVCDIRTRFDNDEVLLHILSLQDENEEIVVC